MHFVFFSLLISISLFGYWVISKAASIDAAIVGIQLSFVGRCFLELAALLILCGFCGIKLKIKQYLPLTLLCTFTMLSTLSIGENGLFYKNVEIIRRNGFTYVVMDKGVLYYVFLGQVVFLFLLFIGILMNAINKETYFSVHNCSRVLAIMLVGTLAFFLQPAVGYKYDLYPIAYIIMEFLMNRMVHNMDMYDIESNIVHHMLKQNEYGYIFVDMKRRFLGANDTAKSLLPQIKSLQIDKPFESKDYPVVFNMSCWMDELDNMEEKHSFVRHIFDDTKTLRCKVRPLHSGPRNKQTGYTIILSDDTQQQKYISLLNNYNTSLEHEVQEKVSHIEDMRDNVVVSIANIVENRDFSTGDHVKRTSLTVRLFVEYLNRTKPELLVSNELSRSIWKAAPMHDLGKLAIRDDILQKPGVYTPEEYDEMKLHSEKGAKIVEQVFADIEDPDFVDVAVNIAHYHHEKWDGTGYPSKLKGEEIPVEARIMALADVFDALVSERCYKSAMSYEDAFEVIRKSLGTHFDPELGKCFIECKKELVNLYEAEVQMG